MLFYSYQGFLLKFEKVIFDRQTLKVDNKKINEQYVCVFYISKFL